MTGSNNSMAALRKWSLSFTIGSFLLVHTGAIVWWASNQTALSKKLANEIVELRKEIDRKVSVSELSYLKNSLDLAIQDIKITIKEVTKDRMYKGEALQIIENLNNKVEMNKNRIADLKEDHKNNITEIKSDIRQIKLDIREILTKKRK